MKLRRLVIYWPADYLQGEPDWWSVLVGDKLYWTAIIPEDARGVDWNTALKMAEMQFRDADPILALTIEEDPDMMPHKPGILRRQVHWYTMGVDEPLHQPQPIVAVSPGAG